MKYIVTAEIESPVKVSKSIEFFDLIFFICYMAISAGFSSMVADRLVVPFFIYSGCVTIALTIKSPFNKNRRNFESIYFMVKRDKEVYKPIYNLGEMENEKEKKKG